MVDSKYSSPRAMFGSQVEPYAEAAKKAGDTIMAATHFAKAGHFLFIDPQSEIWAGGRAQRSSVVNDAGVTAAPAEESRRL